MNQLFNQYGQNQNISNMVQQFQQFRNAFKGDPKQQIQQMLNSGRISQSQYNRAVEIANQMMRMLK